MISEYVGIIKIVLIVLDVLCALMLLRFVLKGLNRGFLRNLFSLILVLVFIFLLTVGAKPTIKKALDIELPFEIDVYAEKVTAHTIIETYAADFLFDGDLKAYQQAEISPLVDDITISFVSIVLFSVLIIFSYLIFMPIITLLCKIFLPFLRKKAEGKKKKYSLTSKLLGLGCAICNFIIFMLIFIIPLYGAIETGQIVLKEAALVDEDIKELSDDVDEAVGKSVVLKLTSNIGRSKNGTFGVGAKTLGSRLLIQTENGNINLIKELDGLGLYFPRAIELATEISNAEDTNEIVSCIEDKDVSKIINWLADSKILKIAYPVGIKIAENYTSDIEEIKDLNIDFDALANIDINKDVASLEPFFIGLLHCAKQVDLENIEAMTILRNKDLINEALETLNLILHLEVTDKVVLDIAINYLNSMFEEYKLSHLKDLVNSDYIKNNLITDIKSAYSIFEILDTNGIIQKIEDGVDLSEYEITEDLKKDFEEILNIIFNLNLIKNHEQKIVQTIFMFTDFDQKLMEEMLKENINWSNEMLSVKQILLEAVEIVFIINFDEDSYIEMIKDIINDEHFTEYITDILDIALNMQLTEKYILPLCVSYVTDILDKADLEELNEVVTVDYIENHLVKDLESLIMIARELEQTGILDHFENKEESEFVITPKLKVDLKKSIDKILDLDLIKNNEKVFVSIIFSYIPEETLQELQINTEEMLNENINWANEAKILVDIVLDVLEIVTNYDVDYENLLELLKNEDCKLLLPNLVEKVFTLELAEKYIAPVIASFASDMLVEAGFSDFKDYVTVEYLQHNFSKDIGDIIDLVSLMDELGLSDSLESDEGFNIDMTNPEIKEKFRTFISTILNLHIIDGHESELVKKLCDLADLNSFVEFDESIFDNVNWDIETNNFVDVIMAVMGLTGIDNFDENFLEKDNFNEVSDQLATLFDALINCSFTRDIAFNLVDSLTNSIGYEIHLTDLEKEKIIANTGKVEFDVLTDMMKDILDLMPEGEDGTIDYTSLNGTDVTNLMIKASDGVIASKIMGTVLNDMLGADGLDIMPKDEITGLPLYDFTDQSTLKEQSTNIGNCIDLVNNLQSFDPEDTDSISNIVDSLKNLDSAEGNNIVNDLLTEFLPVEKDEIPEDIDWTNEADLVEEILNSYEESEDKDNFEIEDEELKERLENSDFAGIILDYLNIFG